MARTIKQIQKSIWDQVIANPVLVAALTSSSIAALWWGWTWVVATAQWVTEDLFDAHKDEVNGIIATQKPHTLKWYETTAKAFQNGDSLPADSDVYNPIAPAGDARLIVTFAGAVELPKMIRLKLATGAPGALGPVSGPQLTSIQAYMDRVKDAGIRVQCTSGVGDTLQTIMKIYFDPLILDATGARIDGTNATPVKDAVNTFLANIDFNTRFVLDQFIAAMEAVDGVTVAEVDTVQAFYGAVPPVVIRNWYVPDAGYLVLDNVFFGANVSYIAYS